MLTIIFFNDYNLKSNHLYNINSCLPFMLERSGHGD